MTVNVGVAIAGARVRGVDGAVTACGGAGATKVSGLVVSAAAAVPVSAFVSKLDVVAGGTLNPTVVAVGRGSAGPPCVERAWVASGAGGAAVGHNVTVAIPIEKQVTAIAIATLSRGCSCADVGAWMEVFIAAAAD